MLFADSPVDFPAWLERYGSFGIIAVMILWGGPKILSEIKNARDSFLAALEKRDIRDEAKHGQAMQTLSALTAEIRELSEKSDRHEKRLDDCPHRHPLPVQQRA